MVHTAVYQEENALPGKRPGKDKDRKTITTGIRLPQENERRNGSSDRKAPKFYIATRGYLVPVIGSPVDVDVDVDEDANLDAVV